MSAWVPIATVQELDGGVYRWACETCTRPSVYSPAHEGSPSLASAAADAYAHANHTGHVVTIARLQ